MQLKKVSGWIVLFPFSVKKSSYNPHYIIIMFYSPWLNGKA